MSGWKKNHSQLVAGNRTPCHIFLPQHLAPYRASVNGSPVLQALAIDTFLTCFLSTLTSCWQVVEIQVQDLPAMASRAGHPFDDLRVMRFCEAVLSWMTECGQATEGLNMHFEYLPSNSEITCQLEPQGDLPGRVRGALKL